MKFPRSEAEIIALGQQILGGLNTNPNLTNSPVPKAQFEVMLNAFLAKRDEIISFEAQLGVKHDEKDDMQEALTDAMQRVIDYLAALTGSDPVEMATIGWIIEQALTKQPPGQPRTLETLKQLEDAFGLDWKNAIDGGRAASYRIERRELPSGDWETCFATNRTEAHLTGQPRGVELEYRVIGFNSNGDSVPSNSVRVVL